MKWKKEHVQKLKELFGVAKYQNRAELRAAIEDPLQENRAIFDQYGPDSEYRQDPESEIADAWRRKVLGRLLPNNRRILAVLDANRAHLSSEEMATVELFRQHIEDLEARHLGDGPAAVGARFPPGIATILMGSSNGNG